MKNFAFVDKESNCRILFDQNGPYWHIATPGNLSEILFITPDDYRYGVTLSALCALETGLDVYAFQLMSNHIHEIVGAASPDQCVENLRLFAKRFKRYATSQGRHLDLSSFVCEPLPILSLQSLRNNIVYNHRNKYVVDSSQTPYSSPWGSGILYFGPDIGQLQSVKFKDLPYREQRSLTNSRRKTFPENYTVRDGYITPESFCSWKTGRAFFRDAHQYFNMLTKNFEAYAEFSALLEDSSCLTDEEMFSAACAIAKQQFNTDLPSRLSDAGKREVARKLHFDFRAGNNQIRRILNLSTVVLESMFPTAR